MTRRDLLNTATALFAVEPEPDQLKSADLSEPLDRNARYILVLRRRYNEPTKVLADMQKYADDFCEHRLAGYDIVPIVIDGGMDLELYKAS